MALAFLMLLFVIYANTLDEAFGYHCDFEEGMCGWESDPANAVGCGWTLRQGLGVTPYSGPIADHTYGNSNGTYLYFQSSYCQDSEGTVMVNLPMPGSTQRSICLKFWYLMYGNGNEYQFALLKKNENIPPIFWRGGSYGRSWKFAQVSIDQSASPYTLTFATVGDVLYGDVAVDDMDILDGQCEPAFHLCDFERGDLCGFNVTTATGDFKWNRDTALNAASQWLVNSLADHTLSSYTGQLAYANASQSGQGTTAMVSPVQNSPETLQCLTFYYFILYNEPAGVESRLSLSVFILTDNQRTAEPAWRAVGGNNNFWEYGTAPISLEEPYQYSFVASKDNLAKGSIFLLDDVSVQSGSCPEKLTCTFTNGSLCGWRNPYQNGIAAPLFAWGAEEPYPEIWIDAPTTAGGVRTAGGYIFVDSKYGEVSPGYVNRAALSSQRLPWKTNGSYCFAFAYRLLLDGNATATLSVEQNSLSGFIYNTIFSTSKSTFGMWIDVQLDVKMIKPNPTKSDFYLVVVGIVSDDAPPRGRIELDNFVLNDHSCDGYDLG